MAMMITLHDLIKLFVVTDASGMNDLIIKVPINDDSDLKFKARAIRYNNGVINLRLEQEEEHAQSRKRKHVHKNGRGTSRKINLREVEGRSDTGKG